MEDRLEPQLLMSERGTPCPKGAGKRMVLNGLCSSHALTLAGGDRIPEGAAQ